MITQLIEMHMDVIPPDSHGQKHGHMNSAIFFILEGQGYDVHDEKKIEWKAGDACIVENACVHQHFATGDKPARAPVGRMVSQGIQTGQLHRGL